ncbi:unnamed protein product [Mesocestoides corti]|uniref:EF-hand domain-containing protein n=1 Tax=Mesocestoides corti TaxID=53468 RepID=A0A158QVT9_MESCO|nr:unnamed protein product [Mesocestoides corti]
MQFGQSKRTSELKEIDPFTQAFNEIDTNGDGVITKADLEEFVRRNDLGDDLLVKSWMNLFDTSNDELITIKAYRERLGLRVDEGYCPKSPEPTSPEMQSYPSQTRPDVRLISGNMPADRQSEIIEEVRRLTNDSPKFKEAELVAELKRWLEDRYDRVWHVILVKGSYWMHYSHEVDCSLQFHMGSHVYLMWRTPAG